MGEKIGTVVGVWLVGGGGGGGILRGGINMLVLHKAGWEWEELTKTTQIDEILDCKLLISESPFLFCQSIPPTVWLFLSVLDILRDPVGLDSACT